MATPVAAGLCPAESGRLGVAPKKRAQVDTGAMWLADGDARQAASLPHGLGPRERMMLSRLQHRAAAAEKRP